MTDEVERIRDVYSSYNGDATIQARRDMTNPGNALILEERTRLVEDLLAERGLIPLSGKRILDVGCGGGYMLGECQRLGAHPRNLFGIDLMPDRIEAARHRLPESSFACGNAKDLDLPDASFDVVILFTVFSSVLDEEMSHAIAAQVRRVLGPSGVVLWYDFRYAIPYNPRTRGMTARRIRRHFPDFELYLRPTTLLPPVARRLGRLTPTIYPMLAAVPVLRTHYLGLLVKKPAPDTE